MTTFGGAGYASNQNYSCPILYPRGQGYGFKQGWGLIQGVAFVLTRAVLVILVWGGVRHLIARVGCHNFGGPLPFDQGNGFGRFGPGAIQGRGHVYDSFTI